MYIIEKAIKLYLKFKKKETEPVIPSEENNAELEDVLTCKHTFMPIDSTGRILACSKCGYLVTKKRAAKKK
jgi:hypothetical protein